MTGLDRLEKESQKDQLELMQPSVSTVLNIVYEGYICSLTHTPQNLILKYKKRDFNSLSQFNTDGCISIRKQHYRQEDWLFLSRFSIYS